MLDQMGRTIDYLRVSVTDRCNLRCTYCMPEQGIDLIPHHDLLSFEEIHRVCSTGAKLGIKKIKLTGGEPLVRRDLPSLARALGDTPGIEQVTLTTNGVLLRTYAPALANAGVAIINVSIDSLDRERFAQITRCDALPQVLDGISAALDVGLHVRINCVPTRAAAKEEFIALAELAHHKPVDVRFIEMMPVGQGDLYDGIPSEELKTLLETQYGTFSPVDTRGNGPATYETLPGFSGRIGFISAVTNRFCSQCNRVRLTSAGFLKLCLDYDLGIDLRGALRAGVDDEQLKKLMSAAIYQKPHGHQFGIQKTSLVRSMAQIGG